jgi:hypothetical protein
MYSTCALTSVISIRLVIRHFLSISCRIPDQAVALLN